MALSNILGFPRIGPNRELKKALESYWKGDISNEQLIREAATIRQANWVRQKDAGINLIPSNDFTLYDHVLDMASTLGVIPKRYGFSGREMDLDTYFAMARGRQDGKTDVTAMEMTKWFDTNYHYIVPELKSDRAFALSSSKVFNEYEEAKKAGITTKPVVLGPVSFLLLSKEREQGVNALDYLPKLLPIYQEILQRLQTLGAEWIQIDEPLLVLDLDENQKKAFRTAYAVLEQTSGIKLLLTTYFGALGDNLELAASLPVQGLHVDLVRAPDQLDAVLGALSKDKILSLGVVDGRNIWKTNLESALAVLEKAVTARGSDNIMVATSCSLLHTPVDLENETDLDAELKNWLAFATQKLDEVSLLTRAINEGKGSVLAQLKANAEALESRAQSRRIHNPDVKNRVKGIAESMKSRAHPYSERRKAQEEALGLPLLPTTTIGSFPQTQEVRKMRAAFKKGSISREEYDAFLEKETANAVRKQEEADIDVLVHGEFERNDMVEYFGEKLEGFAFTKNGWVQSYGSRCVKPPVIFGDVSRPQPMTVRWAEYAQSLTDRQMKGMLTGPVTILQWSFVRDDQPRKDTTMQIGLAIRDEVQDLEKAGIHIIQIDEPAFREGLPLRRADWAEYLNWAVDAFRLSSCGVADATQIHTHMCYSEFNDIIDSIAAMDADVISIETSRSQMELLDAFTRFKYPNEIGPGVYDIHSPRVPDSTEMEQLLQKALDVLTPEQIWVNPDCGLKTRGWKEVEPALIHMVEAAKRLRKKLDKNNAPKRAQA
ncbi:MAG: 5-methyltetrahydropteroyltriglutamate--homocysteine S-methyltransferase [Hyphomicrobiales bacterium]|nr:5-methyltetrahydropteroyltriglutamate--homocysteine S-methyltransferase [Hyphomicrobiales bacterium]